jgi:hypothetical protein
MLPKPASCSSSAPAAPPQATGFIPRKPAAQENQYSRRRWLATFLLGYSVQATAAREGVGRLRIEQELRSELWLHTSPEKLRRSA